MTNLAKVELIEPVGVSMIVQPFVLLVLHAILDVSFALFGVLGFEDLNLDLMAVFGHV